MNTRPSCLCVWLQLELRSLSLLFGESLEGLSLAGTNVDTEALRMVSIRFFHLRSVILSSCPGVRTCTGTVLLTSTGRARGAAGVRY